MDNWDLRMIGVDCICQEKKRRKCEKPHIDCLLLCLGEVERGGDRAQSFSE